MLYRHAREAGWRRGYAADCKSREKPNENNQKPSFSYPDITGTTGEQDTAHTRASRAFRNALILADGKAWNDFAIIIAARLSDQERAGLAYSALMALDDEIALPVIGLRASLSQSPAPIPPLLDLMVEAEEWASFVTSRTLEAYALACVRRMKPERVTAMLRFFLAEAAR